jgi:hypothetical protein
VREKRHLSPAKIQAVAEAAKRQLARTHYADYVEYVHHGRWKRARHLDLICAELEKVITGETKRLMIFMPPRHGKSMTVTATFPSYYLGKYPDRRVIEVSYGDDLAKEFGDANRMKIAEHGCELFGVLLSQTAASKVSWNLEGHSGGMISVGVGGGITGKGADLLILDDLGTEFNSSFFLTNLYSLLNNRLGAKLPTIVTTNITDGALLEKLYTEKISSRLAAFVQIQFLGSDIRVQKAAE